MATGEVFVDLPPQRRSLVLPLSVAGAVVLALAVWVFVARTAPAEHVRTFDSAELGCRFDCSSKLTPGPNFVRSAEGSFLTIERHSLVNARKDFVAGLPDVLFPQVKIQLDQGYRDLEEIRRAPLTLGGRKALEVVLKGK